MGAHSVPDPDQNLSSVAHEEVLSQRESEGESPVVDSTPQEPRPGQKEHSEVKVADNSEPGEAEAEGAGAEKPGRLARLRRSKKKDMPGGLWLKCESCSQVIYRKELEEKGRVCPACDFHFTLPGGDRVRMLLDEGSWTEEYADLIPIDRLEFHEKVTYADKITRTLERMHPAAFTVTRQRCH